MEKHRRSILQIDDDSVDAMMVKQVFKKIEMPFELIQASDGQEALDMLKGENGKEKPDPLPSIILLDVNMPRMNGHEFLDALRADPNLRSILVYMMTTSSSDKDIRSAYEMNIAGYLTKPVDLDQVMNTFKTLKNYWEVISFPPPNH